MSIRMRAFHLLNFLGSPGVQCVSDARLSSIGAILPFMLFFMSNT